jgi:geranylgeranyl diphosphate synthase type II
MMHPMHGLAKSTPIDDLTGPARWSSPVAWLELRETVNRRLGCLVAPCSSPPESLSRAVRHGLLAPGKRVRPLLTMLTAAEFGADPALALDAGCAVELVHTASLVLDDLPCMDDANLRRGLPTTHMVYGEATSVLAAIAMLTRAFGVLAAASGLDDAQRVEITAILAKASGADGLAAGQEFDLNDRTTGDSLTKIDDINHLKTGALFIAAALMGGRIANVGPTEMAALDLLGREVGLAFQALDDVIDASRSTTEAGKDTAKDGGKATVATVLGLGPARAEVRRHMAAAITAIEPHTGPTGPLRTFVTAMFAEAAAHMD